MTKRKKLVLNESGQSDAWQLYLGKTYTHTNTSNFLVKMLTQSKRRNKLKIEKKKKTTNRQRNSGAISWEKKIQNKKNDSGKEKEKERKNCRARRSRRRTHELQLSIISYDQFN